MVGDRVSVATGVQSRERGLVMSSGYLSVTMVARAPLLGSGVSTGGVSAECSRGAVGGFEGAQPLGLGPQSSPVSWYRGFPYVVNGV